MFQPYPWGDGERSAMFHPYYNFTKHGYVTDKEGNPLPKGVYAEEQGFSLTQISFDVVIFQIVECCKNLNATHM